MGKIKRKNHWLPQFYLSHFAIQETKISDSPAIWAFSNSEGDPFSVGINKIAHKRYLYSPENSNHIRSQEFEDFLGDFEGKMATLWKTLSIVNLNFREKSICTLLSYFIASMYLRNIKQLERIRKIKTQIIDFVDRLPKDSQGNLLISGTIIDGTEIEIDPTSFSDYKNPEYDIDHEMFVDTIKENTSEIASALLRKKWTVLKSVTDSFITSDNPVAICQNGNITEGILKKGNRIIFPISPRYLLCIHEDQKMMDGRYYTTNHPEYFNYLLWRNSYNFLLSPRNIDMVLYEMRMLFEECEI